MDKPVDKPSVQYDIKTLTKTRDKLREIHLYLETEADWETEDLTEELVALRIAESFLTDTLGTLQKQSANRAERRRREAQARRSRKRDNRKKRQK